jgi:Chaperone of endosialidase/Head domain of trimeric autotransporter adhesin
MLLKKISAVVVVITLISLSAVAQNIGIGTITPDASAQLDINSTTKGVLMPRLTAAQRVAIVAPANGLMVYQTDGTPGFYYYNGSLWTLMGSGGGSSYWTLNGANIYNSNTANVGVGLAEPANKLTLAGSLLVTEPMFTTSTPPSTGVSQTKTMVNGATSNYLSGDSTGRFYDPGGPAGNYANNQNSSINIPAAAVNTAMELIIESINLAAGDSLIIKENSLSTAKTLLAIGNNYNTTGRWVFNSEGLFVTFKSNADGLNDIGFSILFRRMYTTSATKPFVSEITGNSFLFDVRSGALRSGRINNSVRASLSTAFGVNNNATGIQSITLGTDNTASQSYTLAMGNNNTASGFYATALGHTTEASGNYAMSMGANSLADGVYSTAMGFGSQALGSYSTATGFNTNANGNYSFTAGNATQTTGNNAAAFGSGTFANGLSSFVIGQSSSANNTAAFATGQSTVANGINAASFGNLTNASGRNAIAIGYKTLASATNAVALGDSTRAIGLGALAVGFHTLASGAYSFAAGGLSNNASIPVTASGQYSFAQGEGSVASGRSAVALGFESVASGAYSFVMGRFNTATANESFAVGKDNNATGVQSIAMGLNNTSAGVSTLAMGNGTNASGNGSAALGYYATAANTGSMALGYEVTASGDQSMAFGSEVSTNGQKGALIIGDASTFTTLNSQAPNTFRARFDGGYRFYTSSDLSTNCLLAAGDNSWSSSSDRRLKENLAAVNGEDFLKKIAAMEIGSWNYKTTLTEKRRHYGPMAQDFFAAFGKDQYGTIGTDTTINAADFDGVNLIAIQALEKRTQKIEQLEKENTELKIAMMQLRKEMDEVRSVILQQKK